MNFLMINSFCRELSPVLQLVGQGLEIFKVILPLILIALGIIDIGKAAISSKSDEVKKNMKKFVQKIIVCIVIFFIPTICMIAFSFVEDFNDIKENSGIDYSVCYSCMFNPSDDNCTDAVEIAESNY